ncbi:glycosyl hydrolase family 43 protein [Aspergillus clavatus NRRL 1]|uniref:Glycosyl hydrolase family 43 protein n=1 Tax=Aspergillus clavatus (strain ATCC 1007 / CBS 513.65 / DSM 816 / NCTC 3887 / NRRL 1 / QM 1276 / 107) TaxID=344612 RepID=A1C8H1_ASPCL|nr:glycosyl hydrolase family 43 protein [Aspergillus clavatus NRRL 1]EAW13608.1 glycosyl hydrolase family 43 protein [Aspergillus clavatus NRRL 1]
MLLINRLISILALAQATVASLQIVPGATWTADGTNQHIQAHGGGIIEVDSTYYWIGENKLDGSAFQSINCYSSTNLVEWTFVSELLSRQGSGDLGPNRVVERPKVIYNEATSTYVMWMHIDDSSYKEAKTGVATSFSVCGQYNYLGSFRPLGQQSRDIGLFKDDDSSAYLLTEDRPNGLRINRLTDDYTNLDSTIYLFPEHIEAPAMYKQDGVYFLFGSQLTATNDNKYTTATDLQGTWSSWANFAPSGTHTYDSQTNFIFGVGNSVVYMGDRWKSSNLMASTYIWLPLTIQGTQASLQNPGSWILPLDGTWSAGGATTTIEAESSNNILSNGAKTVSCSGCSGRKSVGWIGGSGNGTLKIRGVAGASSMTTIRVQFENGDSAQRYVTVSVNGESQILAFLPSQDGNTPASSALHVRLQVGSNTITFSGYQGQYGPDIDRLVVPNS